MTKSIRLVQEAESDSELFVSMLYELPTQEGEYSSTIPSTRRVTTIKSAQIEALYEQHPVYLAIDSSAEINMIRTAFAESIGAPIRQTTQHALQADGMTPLNSVGEVHLTLLPDDKLLHLDALVVNDLDVDILAGMPFMKRNDVGIRPSKHQVTIGDGTIIQYPLDTVKAVKATDHHSNTVSIDPDNILTSADQQKFCHILTKYDSIFDPHFLGYNGATEKFECRINMGPVQPPQRKGRLPQYSRTQLQELQQKCDDLEAMGILRKPEDVDISVEYLNPSFLVKKPNGGHRLVTAFEDVGRNSKPQPSLMPDVDSTLRNLGRWKYIIVSDLTSAFH